MNDIDEQTIYIDEWVDARARFGVDKCPDDDTIDNAEFVKICGAKPERFWVKIVLKINDVIIGKVCNELCYEREYHFNDYVSFKKENVFDAH